MTPAPLTWDTFKPVLLASLDADPWGTVALLGLPIAMTLGLLLFPVMQNWRYHRLLLRPRSKVAFSVEYGTWQYPDSDEACGFREYTHWVLFGQVQGSDPVYVADGANAAYKVRALLSKGYPVRDAELMLPELKK